MNKTERRQTQHLPCLTDKLRLNEVISQNVRLALPDLAWLHHFFMGFVLTVGELRLNCSHFEELGCFAMKVWGKRTLLANYANCVTLLA